MADEPTPRGPLLVLLHGLGQWPTTWQPQLDVLPPDWQLAAPWLRGLKPTATEPFDLDRAAGEIAGLPQQYGADRMHLVGEGLGALVALRVAATDPDLVDRLLVSAPPMAPPAWALRLQGAAIRVRSEKKLARRGLSKQRLLSAQREMAALDLSGRLRSVRADTLVLAPGQDRTGTAAARLVAATVPGARLETLPARAPLQASVNEAFNRLAVSFFLEEPDRR